MENIEYDSIFLFGTKVCDIFYDKNNNSDISPLSIQYTKDWINKGFPLDYRLDFNASLQSQQHPDFISDICPISMEYARLYQSNGQCTKKIFATPPQLRQGAIEFASDRKRRKVQIPTFKEFGNFISRPNIHTERSPFLFFREHSPYSKTIIHLRSNGNLYLMKATPDFERIDTALWEKVLLDMAEFSGINAQKSSLFHVPGKRHALVVKRFDRENWRKIHYASAYSLCTDRIGGFFSYLSIANFIKKEGNRDDLPELWRRMAFNVLVNNTDDHLYNHGFLRIGKEWRLSPAFDIEKDMHGFSHALALDDRGNHQGCEELLLEQAEFYNVSLESARETLGKITDAMAHWEDIADRYNVDEKEKKLMEKFWIPEGKGERESPALRM